ncbi:Belongs to the sulfotransferase 1 family [Pristimantis euphronides]
MSQPADLIQIFNGIPFSTRSSAELLRSLDGFQAREDDLLLVSYPKSGTHWLAEIMKHLYPAPVSLTSPIELGDVAKLEELKSTTWRRIIPTHLSYAMLPPDFKGKKCKAIYIIRNLKDTAVSLFHYYRDNPNLPTVEGWSTYLHMFLHGQVVFGSWFDHVLSWEENRNEMGALLLHYESMKKDPFQLVRRICTYLGINISDDEIHDICRKTSFSEMKSSVEQEPGLAHTVCALTSNRKLVFRKGTVGEWKHYFTSKQNRLFDEMYKAKMDSSSLTKHIRYEN